MTSREEKKLDKEIDRLYRLHAQGRQIDIMNIGKVFDAGRKAHLAGLSVEDAVKDAIAKYTTEA